MGTGPDSHVRERFWHVNDVSLLRFQPVVPKSTSPYYDHVRNWLMQIDESDAVTLQPLADSGDALEKVVAPGALIRGFRLLLERIPGYHCLSRAEELSILRTAYLDPEMIVGGLAAAEIWDKTALYTGMTYEELRDLDAAIRDWDDFERELRVLLDGVVGANRQRKHRRGKTILRLADVHARLSDSHFGAHTTAIRETETRLT